MDYKVFVTQDAEADLDKYIWYLIYKKGNRQAAQNVLDDFEETKACLAKVAESLKDCENPRLRILTPIFNHANIYFALILCNVIYIVQRKKELCGFGYQLLL